MIFSNANQVLVLEKGVAMTSMVNHTGLETSIIVDVQFDSVWMLMSLTFTAAAKLPTREISLYKNN